MIAWSLVLLGLATLGSFLFFAVALRRFFLVHRTRYSMLRDFPFEVFGDDFASRALRPLFAFNELVLSFAFVLFAFDARFEAMRVYSFALFAVALARAACYFFLFLVPVDHFRLHMGLVSGSVMTSVLLAGMSAIAFKDLAFFGEVGDVFFVLFLILALCSALPVFNPKLKDWARLKTVENEDGTTYLERPAVFPLALTEWLSYGLHLLVGISFLIGVLVIAGLA